MSQVEAWRTVWIGNSQTLGRPMSRVTIINTRTDKCVDDRGKDRDGDRLG